MTTLKSTSILASIIAQNPFHIVSLQGQMPMSHAQNTYDFEIAEDDPHYDDQGYEAGIREYGHYIAAKSLDIKSEEDYMNHLTDIRLICNEL